MNQRLHQMAVFALVLEEGSFAAAARRLERSPSVVSVHVRELERTLGLRLLHRTTRRLALTEAGERHLPHCQAILDALRHSDALASKMRERVEGRLRVTVPGALLESLVAPTLAALLDAHPDVEVALLESDHRARLEDGEVDVAIRVGRLSELEHRARRLGSLRDLRVARPDSPDRAIRLPWQRQTPATAHAPLEVSSVRAALALVERGLGWAVLPEPALVHAKSLGLRVEPSGRPEPIYAVHALGSQPPPAVRAFIDCAVEVAAAALPDN